jgi:O-antigen ligase
MDRDRRRLAPSARLHQPQTQRRFRQPHTWLGLDRRRRADARAQRAASRAANHCGSERGTAVNAAIITDGAAKIDAASTGNEASRCVAKDSDFQVATLVPGSGHMKFLRISICLIIVFAVLSHGGVEDWARAIIETGAGLLFFLWAFLFYFDKSDDQKRVYISPLLPPLILLAAIALGQLLLRATASTYDTRMELNLLVAYILILFLATQAFRYSDDWRGYIWFIMIFGFLVSTFGILQQLTFNGKLYWFREMRYGGIPFGPYVNRNHFAAFAELVIPVSLVPLVLGKVRRERWFVVAICALLPIGALFLCASRGGVVSFGVEVALLLLITLLRRTGGRHVLAGGLILFLAFLFVSWLGVKQVLDRFNSLQSLEVTTGKRASMRQDTLRIFLDHKYTGTGLGTLQTVFPAYETQYDGKIVNHSHNDYLEMLAETGIAGGICCGWFLGALFFISLRQVLQRDKSFAASLHLSGLLGCSAFLVHSLVDFNLHIPANALLFLVTAHLATTAVLPSPPSDLPPRPLRHQR